MLALTRARVKQALDGFARFVSTHVRRGRFANPFARRRCAFPASPRAVHERPTKIVSAHSDVVIRHLWDADGPGFGVWRKGRRGFSPRRLGGAGERQWRHERDRTGPAPNTQGVPDVWHPQVPKTQAPPGAPD